MILIMQGKYGPEGPIFYQIYILWNYRLQIEYDLELQQELNWNWSSSIYNE